jgi:Tol biopolymer transport system component
MGSGKVMFQRISDGGRVDAVYLIDADAHRTSVVLDTAGVVFGPSISPTGDRVAWLRLTDYQSWYDVYTTDLTGGSLQRLSSFSGNSEGVPAWTPTGSGVVFSVRDYPNAWGIFRRVLTTNSLETLRTFTPGPSGSIRCPSFLTAGVSTASLVSVSLNDGLAYSCGGAIYGAETTESPLALLYAPISPNAEAYSPSWSPDASEIAFLEVVMDADGFILTTSVRILELTTGTIRTAAVVQGSGRSLWHSANTFSLCWLRTAARLVFNAPGTGVGGNDPVRANLYVVSADGTGLSRLTTMVDAFDHSVSCSR